jgi:two-component system NtrC family sensor kinase
LTLSSTYDEKNNIAKICVCDTGVGIEKENLEHIFDPFFSTKEKGTGLGLSVVNGIVTRHNGKVDIDSTPGKGTSICVTLPIT